MYVFQRRPHDAADPGELAGAHGDVRLLPAERVGRQLQELPLVEETRHADTDCELSCCFFYVGRSCIRHF